MTYCQLISIGQLIIQYRLYNATVTHYCRIMIFTLWERLPAAIIPSASRCHGSSRLKAAPTRRWIQF